MHREITRRSKVLSTFAGGTLKEFFKNTEKLVLRLIYIHLCLTNRLQWGKDA
jgi:hypothetical protein